MGTSQTNHLFSPPAKIAKQKTGTTPHTQAHFKISKKMTLFEKSSEKRTSNGCDKIKNWRLFFEKTAHNLESENSVASRLDGRETIKTWANFGEEFGIDNCINLLKPKVKY